MKLATNQARNQARDKSSKQVIKQVSNQASNHTSNQAILLSNNSKDNEVTQLKRAIMGRRQASHGSEALGYAWSSTRRQFSKEILQRQVSYSSYHGAPLGGPWQRGTRFSSSIECKQHCKKACLTIVSPIRIQFNIFQSTLKLPQIRHSKDIQIMCMC